MPPNPEQPFIIPKEKLIEGLKTGDYRVLSDEEEAELRGTKVKKEEKPPTQESPQDIESINTKYTNFLKETYKIWSIDDNTINQANITPEIINPSNIDYEARKNDTDPTKFGEYTVNPETQNIDFKNAKLFTLPEEEQKELEGKTLSEVAEYIKTTYGNRYHIPGIEFWKYILENPDKAPNELKDGKYHFFFGSLVRASDGDWRVPYANWHGSQWDRYGLRFVYSWASRYRVVLLETI